MNLYVISNINKNPVKIGFAKDVKKRLRELQTGSSEQLYVYYSEEYKNDIKKLEKLVHKNISRYRIKGEWFSIDVDDAINELKFIKIRYDESPYLI